MDAEDRPETHPLERAARDDPDALALVDGDRRLSRGRWEERATRLANALAAELGMEPGDRAAIRVASRIEYFELTFALAKLRVHAMPVPRDLGPDELRRALALTGACLLVEDGTAHGGDVHSRVTVSVGDAPADASGEGLEALIDSGSAESRSISGSPPGDALVLTSGTSGRPKAAVRAADPGRADAVRATYEDLFGALGFHTGDRHLLAGTVDHTMPAFYARHTLERGGAVVIMRRFEPGEALELLAAERITSAFLGPDMLNRLTAHAADAPAPPDLSQLRAVMSGGTDLPSELAGRVDELLGPGRLFDLYGTVETGLVTVAGEGERRRAPGSVGRPLAGVELRILASDGSPAPKGTAGRIAVRAPTLVEGYLEEPEATAEAFTDGFFAPGDVGRTDEEGHLFVLDRVADVIHVAGVEILPSDVERVLREDPAVLDAAAVADSEGGERVRAAVEARPGMGVDTDALLRRCAEVLPRHAVPDVLEVVEELPRTALGKVVRRTVREHLFA